MFSSWPSCGNNVPLSSRCNDSDGGFVFVQQCWHERAGSLTHFCHSFMFKKKTAPICVGMKSNLRLNIGIQAGDMGGQAAKDQ